MKHVLIIDGNPDPAPDRLTIALAQAYGEGAEAENCTVQRLGVGALGFPLLRTAAAFAVKPDCEVIRHAQTAFVAADHVAHLFSLAGRAASCAWLDLAPFTPTSSVEVAS